jgi:ribosomal protein L33
MKDVRVDDSGTLHCWNCGSENFTEQRTTRAKVLVGVGALLTKKKLKCVVCGEYNDTGSAKPYKGPEGRKYRKTWEVANREAAGTSPPSPQE